MQTAKCGQTSLRSEVGLKVHVRRSRHQLRLTFSVRLQPDWNGGQAMLTNDLEQCFDSIESVQDFMKILADTVLDCMKELSNDREIAIQDGEERRAQAIKLAQYKLKLLGCYVHKSRLALNDLRTIRRLILNERQVVEKAMAASAHF